MIVAPFLGEFGWEVALWVPWLRQQRRYSVDFVVLCKNGHEGLYKDFATEVVPYTPPKLSYVDCQHAWVGGVKLRPEAYAKVCHGHGKVTKKSVLTPYDLSYTWTAGCPKPRSANHKRLGKANNTEPGKSKMLAIHARECGDKQPDRNWSFNKWATLVGELNTRFQVASIGQVGQAMHLPGTENMRGMPLAKLCDLLASCRYAIGPSSGPLHLANHCGTPVIWWSGNEKDQERYAKVWNPWGSLNLCAAETWDPDVDEVLVKL